MLWCSQKAIESQKVKITREGIYIQSARLTKKQGPPGVSCLVVAISAPASQLATNRVVLSAGKPVFFRLRVANVRPRRSDSAACSSSPSLHSSPRTPKASPRAKTAKKFAMAITRMDKGFEIPEVTHPHSLSNALTHSFVHSPTHQCVHHSFTHSSTHVPLPSRS